MEYADGGDLWDLVQGRYQMGQRLSEHEVLSFFVQICMALKYMHDRKMLHRDLKTGNVFLNHNGTAKVYAHLLLPLPLSLQALSPVLVPAAVPAPACAFIKIVDWGLPTVQTEVSQQSLYTRCYRR